MAFSGTVGLTSFNINRVVDTAFRRCRLPAQAITAEMQRYALDALYLLLSEWVAPRTLSWCIERLILPMYQGQPVVTLPLGTVDVLKANYRSLQALTPASTTVLATTYAASFSAAQDISTIGVKFSGTGTALTVQTSPDGIAWTSTAFIVPAAASGIWSWLDLTPFITAQHVRLLGSVAWAASDVVFGNNPAEIPLGVLNRDTYTVQTNKIFQGRPTTFWHQRNVAQPVINLWPAPNADAEHAQLIVWRHRHIMDAANLREDLEVPQRWLNAVAWNLAYAVAMETPTVDANLMPILKGEAEASKSAAYDGESDGSPSFIQPMIAGYSR